MKVSGAGRQAAGRAGPGPAPGPGAAPSRADHHGAVAAGRGPAEPAAAEGGPGGGGRRPGRALQCHGREAAVTGRLPARPAAGPSGRGSGARLGWGGGRSSASEGGRPRGPLCPRRGPAAMGGPAGGAGRPADVSAARGSGVCCGSAGGHRVPRAARVPPCTVAGGAVRELLGVSRKEQGEGGLSAGRGAVENGAWCRRKSLGCCCYFCSLPVRR